MDSTRSIFTLFLLLLGFALLQMGNALQGTLLAVRGDIEGFDTILIGLLTSSFYAGMCIGSLFSDKLIIQAGHIRTFAALASLGSAAALGHLMLVNSPSWIALRFVTGFCFAGLIIVVESWLNAASTTQNRGKVLSTYSISAMGAAIVGQLLFTTGDPQTFSLFVLVSIAMSLALVPISLSRAAAPMPSEDQESPSLKRLWQISPFGAFSMVMIGTSAGALYGLLPVYTQRLGYSQNEIGILMAALMLGGVLLQFPLGALSDIFPRRIIALLSAFGAAVACAALIAFDTTFITLLILITAIGGLALPTASIVIAHVNDRAPATALVAVASALLLLYGIGAVIGPFLAGFLLPYGPWTLPAFVAVGQGLLVLWAIARMMREDDVDAALKTSFAAAPMSPVTADLEMAVYEEAVEEAESSELPENRKKDTQ